MDGPASTSGSGLGPGSGGAHPARETADRWTLSTGGAGSAGGPGSSAPRKRKRALRRARPRDGSRAPRPGPAGSLGDADGHGRAPRAVVGEQSGHQAALVPESRPVAAGGKPVYTHDMGFTAWDRLFSLFPPVARAAASLPAPTSGTVGPAREAAPLPRWLRDFWFFGVVTGARPSSSWEGRARSVGHPGGNMGVRLDAMPAGSSAGGRMAIFLGLCLRAEDCDCCGRRLVGRSGCLCDRCGCRLCGPPCATQCRRAAAGLVSGCAARFCALCEPGHVCSRYEPLVVYGWQILPNPTPPATPQREGTAGGGAAVRCSSSPPGGGA